MEAFLNGASGGGSRRAWRFWESIVRSATRLIYKFVREAGAVHPAAPRLKAYKSVQSAVFDLC